MNITINPWLEYVKIILIGEASSWKSDPLGSSLYKEAARVELTPHQWNTKGMAVVRYNVRGPVDYGWWDKVARFIWMLSVEMVIEQREARDVTSVRKGLHSFKLVYILKIKDSNEFRKVMQLISIAESTTENKF